jgi:hypothetical protein
MRALIAGRNSRTIGGPMQLGTRLMGRCKGDNERLPTRLQIYSVRHQRSTSKALDAEVARCEYQD